jgi:hypothetical protein
MARYWDSKDPEDRRIAEMGKLGLSRHLLEMVEVKTARGNLIQYSDKLPRAHNVLQARTGSWAVRKRYGLEAAPYLIYFAVGSGAKALEFACGGGAEDDYADVEREINTLQVEWAAYKKDGTLPPVKPLGVKVAKEKSNRVVFRVADWECNKLYCPFCTVVDRNQTDGIVRDGLGCCEPLMPNLIGGDRLGYEEEDGSVTYCKQWTDKVEGFSIVGMAQTVDKPRAKEEA